MKLLEIPIDGWFDSFSTLPHHPGHLPDLNIDATALGDYSNIVPLTASALGNPVSLGLFNLAVFSIPAWHSLSAVAICFWSGVTCWKCRAKFTAHVLISKVVLGACTLKTIRQTNSDGKVENLLQTTPTFILDTSNNVFSFITYEITHLDRCILNTWLKILVHPALGGLIEYRPAELSYRTSHPGSGPYWAMSCPHCLAIQGEHFLKSHPSLDAGVLEDGPMSRRPDLMVIPKLKKEILIGGFCLSRGFVSNFGNDSNDKISP